MASATYLSNPVVNIGVVPVDLTDMCSAATLTNLVEALEDTAFGTTSRSYTAGLANNEVTLTFYASYAASETYATLQPLVGTKTTLTLQPTSGVDSPTNPKFILTGCYLESLPVINASLGELSTFDVTFTGGALTIDTTV
jgi:hypothetical protein